MKNCPINLLILFSLVTLFVSCKSEFRAKSDKTKNNTSLSQTSSAPTDAPTNTPSPSPSDNNSNLNPPSAVSASIGDKQSVISWSSVSGASTYNLYWATNNSVTKNSAKIAGIVPSYSLTGLTNGTTYYIGLTSSNASGESSMSELVSVTPVDPPTISTISKSSGGTKGRVVTDITGTGFTANSTVKIGQNFCTSTTYTSPTLISCVTPPLDPGVYDLTVTNPSGLSGTLAAAFTAKNFLFVVNASSNNISVFTVNPTTGVASEVSGSPYATGATVLLSAEGGKATPDGKFLYITIWSGSQGGIYAFNINPETAQLTTMTGSPFSAGGGMDGIDIDSTGSFLYAADTNGYLVGKTINKLTGALTDIATYTTGGGSGWPAIHPSGRFVATFNSDTNNLHMFSIDSSSGALTAVPGSPYSSSPIPLYGIFDITGKFLYVSLWNTASILAYSVDQSTGALSVLSGSPFTTGTGTKNFTMSVDGRFVYVVNRTSNNLYAYEINSTTGALTQISGSPYSVGSTPIYTARDTLGKFLFLGSDGSADLKTYTINSSTGALSLVAGSTVSTGSTPKNIIVN